MRHNILIAGIILLLITLSACNQVFYLDQKKDFKFNQKKIKHLISISPDFELPAILSTSKSTIKTSYQKEDTKSIYETLERQAKANGIHLQIEGGEVLEDYNADYFNYLAPLKREVLKVLYLQDFSEIEGNNKSSEPLKLHPKGLKFGFHFSHLAEKYGTPYFALHGISYKRKNNAANEGTLLAATVPSSGSLNFMTADGELVFYTIIADVSTSEIVYRELRQIDSSLSSSALKGVIKGSFAQLMK